MNKNFIQQIYLLILGGLIIVCTPAVEVRAQGQQVRVTIEMENVPMQQVITEIEKQTKFLFGVNDDVDVTDRVTVKVANQLLQTALDQMTKGTSVVYRISGSNIILSQKEKRSVTVSGVVRDVKGDPIIGAAVVVKGTTIGTSTNIDGSYTLQLPPPHRERQS